MKANRCARHLLVLAAAALAGLASGCSERIVPAPTPRPLPRPAPAPPPPSPRPAALDWRQAPITPGDWTWGMEGGQSVARFAGGALVLRCDPTNRTITLQRSAAVAGPEPMTISTTSTVRTLSAAPLPGAAPALGVVLNANDPLLDAMIFSRGRFAVEAPGVATLYVPSWPEVSRVTEDCR
jgi:hypothetical protein